MSYGFMSVCLFCPSFDDVIVKVKLGHHDKARECFSRSAAIRPHVVTYNAWAIMEERLAHDMKVRSPLHFRYRC